MLAVLPRCLVLHRRVRRAFGAAGAAWLAELVDGSRKRAKGKLGFTQALLSVGGLLGRRANGLAITWGVHSVHAQFARPAIQIPDFLSFLGARYAGPARSLGGTRSMSGLIPAVPLIIIRPFLPEVAEVAQSEPAARYA